MIDRLRPPHPQEPDSLRQDEALRKGLGRAVLWSDRGRLTDEDVLLNACLHDQRYDGQIDDSRGDWLWRIIKDTAMKETVRVRLLDSLRGEVSENDIQQRCQLAFHFARDGDSQFQQCLHKIIAERRFPAMPWVGEDELIRLEGEAGLLFAAQVRGVMLHEGKEWFDDDLISSAKERLGEGRVHAALSAAAESDEAIRRYYEAWQQDQRSRTEQANGRQAHTDRMRAITVDETIATAESGRPSGPLRGWGMYADETDLRTILGRLLECREPRVLANYLRIFSNRAVPEFDDRLLELVAHPDDEVRRRAITAVAQNSNSAIRSFIERSIGNDPRDHAIIELFARNFRSGDEATIERLIPAGDENRRHGALFKTLEVLERNTDVDCSRLVYLIYEMTPCGNCRYRAVKLLVGHNVVLDWLAEECRFDSQQDTRLLFGGPNWGE